MTAARKQSRQSLSAYTPVHAAAAISWLETMRHKDEWGITVDEQAELLGGVNPRTLRNWKVAAATEKRVELSRDTMERLSLLLGIYKGLKLIAPANRPDVAAAWFSTPNAGMPFNGQSPKDFIIAMGRMEALYAVRRYLDAARGSA